MRIEAEFPKRRHRNGDDPDPDIDRLLIFAGAVAVALFFSSLLPHPLTWAVFAGFMQWAAIGAIISAVLRAETLWGPTLTGWDQAAGFLLLSLITGLFVEPGAASDQLVSLVEQSRPEEDLL